MFAIAAMSRNGVIGSRNGIPWRIAEEHRFFRRKTMNGVVIMGRRTFESLPAPLEGRINVVLTRNPLVQHEQLRTRFPDALVGAAAHRLPNVRQLSLPKIRRTEVRLVRSIESLVRAGLTREQAWLCGGAQVYRQFLSLCTELFLTVVDRDVEGDAFFPPFEHLFDLNGVVHQTAEFRVLHYKRNQISQGPDLAELVGSDVIDGAVPVVER